MTSETYPSGRQIATQFDGAGREKKIDGALGGQPSVYLSSIAYAPHGGVGSMQYGNNVWHEVNYNSRLQPYQALDVINNDPNQLLRAECLYWSGSYNLTTCGAENHTDNNGNPRATVFWYGNGGTSVSASFNETFAYDGVNRLTGVVDNGGWSRYFAYDQYSNMWLCGWPGIAPNGAAPTANYCSQTPSELFNTANQIIGRSYDGAGNMASLMGSNFTYDAENRITSAVQSGIGTATYTYDGDGRRVMKSVSTGLQTVYVYDIGGKLVAEYSSGAVSVPPCHTCFLSTDHLGSTRLVTDENGTTVSRHDYIPFGEEIAANSGGRDSTFGTQDFVNQKFTGKERDQETGLDFFGARYYGSALGRFTSPDPTFLNVLKVTNPQRWNLYSYGVNNPLRYVDPDGEEAIAISYPNYQVGVRGNFTLPLGHAGVVMVAKDGSTHYFEYGRYAGPEGIVRNAGPNNTPTPSLERDASGKITPESMKNLLQTLSDSSGKHGAVEAAVIDTSEIEDTIMEAYLEARQAQNSDPNRQHYSLFGGHNCGTLVCDALSAAGHRAPAARAGQLPANLFGYFTGMPSYFGVTQQFAFTPQKEKVKSKFCYTGDNGKQVCQ